MTTLSEASGSSVQVLSTNHPTHATKVAVRRNESREQAYTVYIHERGKKPRLTDVRVVGKIPSTITDQDRTFYWVGADLSQRTLTYTDIKPGVGA